MKIYFAASIRGGRDDREVYQHIIAYLQTWGTVLTEHIALPDLGDTAMTDQQIWEMDMAWLDVADIVIAEISQPSIGVGYEIGRAEHLGIPVVALYREGVYKKISAMVSGNPAFAVYTYRTLAELKEILATIFQAY